MEVWVLVLFLAGQKIEAPGVYGDKKECIAVGEQSVASFKEAHKHSRAWFWCVPGNRI